MFCRTSTPLLFSLLISASSLSAQYLFLDGSVVDAQGAALEGATVSLLNASDSALIKIELSDAAGRYRFDGAKPGDVLVAVTMLGFERYFSEVFKIDGQALSLPQIRLRETTTAITEVTVSAKKPFVERRPDRTIVNVESSILSAGSSALEVLERSPGIVVGSDDAISVRGRPGVVIMLDGKPTPLSGQDLSNFLRSLPSNSIERIEIITNPSAKYDAAGNAGIIDIRMKKDKRLGTNGAVSGNYGQGVYPKAGAGINLNHRNKKVNIFGSYNYGFRKGMNDLRLYRAFFEGDQSTGAYDQRNYLVIPYNNHVARAGLDFFPNAKTTMGLLASGNYNHFNPKAQNTSVVENGAGEISSYFGTGNQSFDRWTNYALNGNFKRSIGKKGGEFTADIDVAEYGNKTEQNFTTVYTGLNGEKIRPDYLLLGDLRGSLNIKSIKADYSLPYSEKGKIEAGFKSSIVDADNDLKFYDRSNPADVRFDSLNSNHFIYRENINAAYLNTSNEWGKFSLQAGLRAEHTGADGTQLVDGESFRRDYLNWFPSVFLQYKFSEKLESGLNLSRRLDRPSYRQLNPFKSFLDPSTYSAGNPFLNPQFTWSFEWNNTFWQKLHTTIAWSHTTDNITHVIAPVSGQERVTVQTDSNLAVVNYASFAASYHFDLTSWWSAVNNFNLWQGVYSGNLANTPLRDGNVVAHLTTNHHFKWKNNWGAELNFTYKTREVYGFMDLNPMWGLGCGLQKSFWNRRATLKLAVTDIFWQNLPSATIRFADYVETFEVFRETRTATLSFNYRFGNNEVTSSRRRQGGAEDEKRRASGGGS